MAPFVAKLMFQAPFGIDDSVTGTLRTPEGAKLLRILGVAESSGRLRALGLGLKTSVRSLLVVGDVATWILCGVAARRSVLEVKLPMQSGCVNMRVLIQSSLIYQSTNLLAYAYNCLRVHGWGLQATCEDV